MSGLVSSSLIMLLIWVIASQIIDHINPNGLDNKNQAAYKGGHSAETALLSIKSEIRLSLSKGEALPIVLLDQSVAFDTIDHSTLVSCLQTWFGNIGTVLRWFWSYLPNHFQCIKISLTLSELWPFSGDFCLVSPKVQFWFYQKLARSWFNRICDFFLFLVFLCR